MDNQFVPGPIQDIPGGCRKLWASHQYDPPLPLLQHLGHPAAEGEGTRFAPLQHLGRPATEGGPNWILLLFFLSHFSNSRPQCILKCRILSCSDTPDESSCQLMDHHCTPGPIKGLPTRNPGWVLISINGPLIRPWAHPGFLGETPNGPHVI